MVAFDVAGLGRQLNIIDAGGVAPAAPPATAPAASSPSPSPVAAAAAPPAAASSNGLLGPAPASAASSGRFTGSLPVPDNTGGTASANNGLMGSNAGPDVGGSFEFDPSTGKIVFVPPQVAQSGKSEDDPPTPGAQA